MNYLKIFFVITLVILTSCKQNKKTDLDLSSRPELINISDCRFNGKPLILSQNEIIKIFGKPTFKKKNCVIFSDLSTSTKELKYDCWVYDSIYKFGFDTYDKIGYLSYLSFDSENVKIETPKILLNSETVIDEIKSKFPNAYKLKITDSKNGNTIISLNDNLLNETKEFANIIELGFDSGNLKYYKYQIESEYITDLNKK
ncbi:MAG: hypothetical protein ABJQ39_04595 [Winogradskyella arenosi]